MGNSHTIDGGAFLRANYTPITRFKSLFAVFIVALVFSTYVLPIADAQLRYVKYLLPIMVLMTVAVFGYQRHSFTKAFINYFKKYSTLYAILIGFSLLVVVLRNDLHQRFFEEAFLMLAPLILARTMFLYYRPEQRDSYIKLAFYGITISYFMESHIEIVEVIQNPTLITVGIIRSELASEDRHGFVFGMFAVYFLMHSNKKYAALAMVLTVLAFKRIALFGVLMCALLHLLNLPRKDIRRYSTAIPFVALLANLFVVFVAFEFLSGTFDHIIRDVTGLSANHFFMGRQFLYSELYEELKSFYTFFGFGIGKTYQVLADGGSGMLNLHSDVLKHYIEFGLILFTVWIYLMYRFTCFDKRALVLMTYLNILFLTDNVFIYFDVMFFFYFFTCIVLLEKRNGVIEAPAYR